MQESKALLLPYIGQKPSPSRCCCSFEDTDESIPEAPSCCSSFFNKISSCASSAINIALSACSAIPTAQYAYDFFSQFPEYASWLSWPAGVLSSFDFLPEALVTSREMVNFLKNGGLLEKSRRVLFNGNILSVGAKIVCLSLMYGANMVCYAYMAADATKGNREEYWIALIAGEIALVLPTLKFGLSAIAKGCRDKVLKKMEVFEEYDEFIRYGQIKNLTPEIIDDIKKIDDLLAKFNIESNDYTQQNKLDEILIEVESFLNKYVSQSWHRFIITIILAFLYVTPLAQLGADGFIGLIGGNQSLSNPYYIITQIFLTLGLLPQNYGIISIGITNMASFLNCNNNFVFSIGSGAVACFTVSSSVEMTWHNSICYGEDCDPLTSILTSYFQCGVECIAFPAIYSSFYHFLTDLTTEKSVNTHKYLLELDIHKEKVESPRSCCLTMFYSKQGEESKSPLLDKSTAVTVWQTQSTHTKPVNIPGFKTFKGNQVDHAIGSFDGVVDRHNISAASCPS